MALPEFLSGSRQIEVITADLPAADYKYVIFDFDGTLSLIREGWRGIMIPMMVDLLEVSQFSKSLANYRYMPGFFKK